MDVDSDCGDDGSLLQKARKCLEDNLSDLRVGSVPDSGYSSQNSTIGDDESLMTITAVIEQLNEELYICDAHCMCKLSHKARTSPNHIRTARAQPTEIWRYRFHGGHLYLLCKLEKRTCPEYLKPCQIPEPVRKQYSRLLQDCIRCNKPPKAPRKWTREDELELRKKLYPELTKDQVRIQSDIMDCDNTTEWVQKTHNGRAVVPSAPVAPLISPTARPAAVMAKESEVYFEVERIIGTKWISGRTEYLIKWLGYPVQEATWEPHTAVQMSRDAVEKFQKDHGKPSKADPLKLSDEGRLYERSSKSKPVEPSKGRPAEAKKQKRTKIREDSAQEDRRSEEF